MTDQKNYDVIRYCQGNVICKGDNYRLYGCCVHVFETEVENEFIVQSNREEIIKKIVILLKNKYNQKCNELLPYMIRIIYQKDNKVDDNIFRKIEIIVDDIIEQMSNDGKTVYKFIEKNNDPMYINMNHLPTIIIW